ncbi:unnamed protein product [Protopolystoma xenopodis]|uniref:Uncharacterized protein n=1 Tax=Protopolystoma xenopodis TaxID=117903 RepID=A0A448WY96_9PLAT|nr:unnamed protein product [Protopolystoma xenopodis]
MFLSHPYTHDLDVEIKILNQELAGLSLELERERTRSASLEARLGQVTESNVLLEQGLRELNDGLAASGLGQEVQPQLMKRRQETSAHSDKLASMNVKQDSQTCDPTLSRIPFSHALTSNVAVEDCSEARLIKVDQAARVDEAKRTHIDCPALEKLLAALDARQLAEDPDTGRFMKARIDHLEVSQLQCPLKNAFLNLIKLIEMS